MAQGNKSRFVIWTIVGILVVVAVVMLVTRPKDSVRPPLNPERFGRQMESRLQKLEKKISAAQADFPGAPAELWQAMSDDIAHARQALADMSSLTEQRELEAKKDSVQKAYTAARKTLKDITGQEQEEEPGGE
jgi:hypothetical protein